MRPPSFLSCIAVLALSALLTGCATPGDPARHGQAIVDEARTSLAHFAASPGMQPALAALPTASAIVIFPRLASASVVVGASEAEGVLYVRDLQTGHWAGPMFYSLAEGSIGLQAGVSRAEVLMIVNSHGALTSLFKGRLRLGMDASVTVGKGGGASSAITSDVDSYALSKGLFAGIALAGSALRARSDLNAAWYGRTVKPDDLVDMRDVQTPSSARLSAAIEALASR